MNGQTGGRMKRQRRDGENKETGYGWERMRVERE